jgi:PIN domain nuclease of toxin-antitoxin system
VGSPEVILLDTHVWVWLNGKSSALPHKLVNSLSGRPLAISCISIWETMMLIEKGRLKSKVTPEITVRTWLQGNAVQVLPVTEEIAILSRTLPFMHDDPADRFIASTAFHHSVTLATDDVKFTSLPWLQTVSST